MTGSAEAAGAVDDRRGFRGIRRLEEREYRSLERPVIAEMVILDWRAANIRLAERLTVRLQQVEAVVGN